MSDAITRLKELREKAARAATEAAWAREAAAEAATEAAWAREAAAEAAGVAVAAWAVAAEAKAAAWAVAAEAEAKAENTIKALLACAEALEKIASNPTGGIGCNPAELVKIARAALDALEEERT